MNTRLRAQVAAICLSVCSMATSSGGHLQHAAPQAPALTARNIRVVPGIIEFDLYNTSDRPITAWTLRITATINGKQIVRDMCQDFARSTWHATRHPSGRHLSGALMPGDFHPHLLPVGTAGSESRDQVSVDVLAVIFEDGRFIGDSNYIDNFFADRNHQRSRLKEILDELEASYAKGNHLGEITGWERRLAKELNWPQGTPPPVMTEGNSARATLLNDIRQLLRVLEGQPRQSPGALFRTVIDKVRNEYEALSKHSKQGSRARR